MPAIVSLPHISWGDPTSSRHALLIHGLGSNGALMWRFGLALAEAGWHATAVDLRGHGTAPRALDYTIAAYAADVAALRPAHTDMWDLVVGHSLGGAAATVAAVSNPSWAARLALIDPAIHLSEDDRSIIRQGQEASFAQTTVDAVRALNPTWHPQDVELKARAVREASRFAVEQTSIQNTPWDVRAAAARLTVPTHVIASDEAVHSIFGESLAAEVLANPVFSLSRVPGAGHSPHRDKPQATIEEFLKRVHA